MSLSLGNFPVPTAKAQFSPYVGHPPEMQSSQVWEITEHLDRILLQLCGQQLDLGDVLEVPNPRGKPAKMTTKAKSDEMRWG